MTSESGVIDQPSWATPEVPVSAESGVDGAAAPTPNSACDSTEPTEEEYMELLGKLPAEIGAMLIIAGVAGVLLPGPIGTPMIIAGALVVWPKTFAPVERSFAKYCPQLHREGVRQVRRYVSDLQRRFPD